MPLDYLLPLKPRTTWRYTHYMFVNVNTKVTEVFNSPHNVEPFEENTYHQGPTLCQLPNNDKQQAQEES